MWYKNEPEFKVANGYELNGIWYPRVTRILEVKAKPALQQFFKEMESYSLAEEVKEKSALHGSLVHEAIEKILLGESVEVPTAIAPGVETFQRFNEQRGIAFHPGFVERTVWSQRYRYAGTIDALATIDGKFGVLDIKTSTGFYPEYNLQTAAYVAALQEFPVRRMLGLASEIQTRWILRIDQRRICRLCDATMRTKGGRVKIRGDKKGSACESQIVGAVRDQHEWGDEEGEVELREFPFFQRDIRAFIAAKTLWEWENGYWLRKIGYSIS